MILPRLRRVRWAVRATLVLGVAASVVANILHALDNPISQAIAAWPPLALLLTVELISRVPVHRRSLAVARFGATAIIAGIAAWVSYWHMVGVAARYGETGASPYLLPLSVDGLIVVASICLVELGGRIASLERSSSVAAVPGLIPVPAAPVPAPAPVPPPASEAAATIGAEAASVPARQRTVADAFAEAAVALPKRVSPKTPEATFSAPMTQKPRSGKPRRSPAETLAEATRIKAKRPDVTDTQLAEELGISAARWRTIRRETGADDMTLAA